MKYLTSCFLGLLITICHGSVFANEAIKSTQVTIVVEDGRQLTKFQATVLLKSNESLTILTGAHCLAATEDGLPLVVTQPGRDFVVRGSVAKVNRNPYYAPGVYGPTPGTDNAIAVIKVKPADDEQTAFLESLALADLVEWPAIGSGGQAITIHVQDQKGILHVVRASNFSNPKWLEWGPAYQPIPGDSGSGMFVVLRDGAGKDRVLLIGSLVDRSLDGGGGSLLCKRYRWVNEALTPAKPK